MPILSNLHNMDLVHFIFIPHVNNKVVCVWGYIVFTPSACLSVRSSVCPSCMLCPLCGSTSVGTPYNMALYTTGSNIAQLCHGSQNLWRKLWIPVVKETLNRLLCVLLSYEKVSPKRKFMVAPTSQMWPRFYHHRCRRHPLWIWHNRHYMPLWPSIHSLEHVIDANCIFTDTWAHQHRHPMVPVRRLDGLGPCYQNNATSLRNIESIWQGLVNNHFWRVCGNECKSWVVLS